MSFYKFITGFVALGTAACAAFFSVIGIATFLGGNFIEVAIMAGFLEAGKLVCASAAYRFRKMAAGWIRGLLVTFTIIMMFITSTGIFGFLSSSYQQAASERDISEQEIENVQTKKQSLQKRAERLEQDRQQLRSTEERLQDLQAEQGWLSERQDQRLSNIPNQISETDSALTATRDSILSLNQRITELEANQGEEAKLGPIMFVADTVGLDPDQAALYFILLLIFVFDPMAVTLVVALSMATEDFEETVTEEKTDGSAEVVVNDPIGKTVDVENIREELGKPLPEEPQSTAETDDQKNVNPAPDNDSQPTEGPLEDDSGESMGEKVRDQPLSEKAADVVGNANEEVGRQRKDEEGNSQNKTSEESVEETEGSEEEGYKAWVKEAANEDRPSSEDSPGEEQGFEDWVGGENSPEEEKPWKNPFKPPFNS